MCDVLKILIVGLENTGKTEIAYKICNIKRDEYLQTKGCRVFDTTIGGISVQLTEVGGALEFRDVWKYYFLDMYGIVFVVDASSINNIYQSHQTFKNLMAHDFLIGKPFLIIANKQDLPSSVDCIDICEYLGVELLANKYRNPCMIEACGNWGSTFDEYDGLQFGVNWLVKTIIANKQFLVNRINFHRIMLENGPKLFGSHRPYTGVRRKNSKPNIKETHPKTAPPSHRHWLRENNSNYLSKRNSIVSLGGSRIQAANYAISESTENTSINAEQLAAIGEIVEHADNVSMNKNHTETIVIIRNRTNEDLTVQDLSLTIHSIDSNKHSIA
ncbi:ADP-ribosylation factor-like protein 13B isoform X2 [Toxorhynchites rutilus septentrionalis]|uniref:ADP-ribosylation factor-like protein 13B isoform X2 n=1 Tax=Toxorhynchites rutilus septentrionalis TaxID=329112 RepID=UPI0024784CCE|nr:ADP-ribosylation factor-like protein 13B isoform X2 [Toxorhynchites rutilus septentrionalis]